MKYLFVHDHVLIESKKHFYSTGGLSNKILRRYLFNNDDQMIVYTRYKKMNDKNLCKHLIQVDDKRIICRPSLFYHSPKDLYKVFKIKKEEIGKLVEECDFFIIRIPSFLGYFVYDIARRKNKKYVLEVVACPYDSFYNHGEIIGKLVAPFMSLKMKMVCKNAKNIVYVSNEFLQKRYPTKGEWISCSNVNLENIYEDNLQKRINKIKKFNNREVIKIGLIGSLNVSFKGHYEAIRMVQLLKQNGYKIEMHFLGSGKKDKWLKYIEKCDVLKNIVFDGTLPNGEPVLKWLDEMDIYIIPSLQEGLPRSLIEAMSRACPSVGMKTGGIPELIDKKFICSKKNYHELYQKVRMLIEDKNEMLNQANRNFKTSKKYLKKNLDERREKFFNTIIKSR